MRADMNEKQKEEDEVLNCREEAVRVERRGGGGARSTHIIIGVLSSQKANEGGER